MPSVSCLDHGRVWEVHSAHDGLDRSLLHESCIGGGNGRQGAQRDECGEEIEHKGAAESFEVMVYRVVSSNDLLQQG